MRVGSPVIRLWGRLGLTPRLILVMVVVASVPVVLIALFALGAGSQGIRERTESHLTSIVSLKSQEVQRWLRPYEAAADILSNSP